MNSFNMNQAKLIVMHVNKLEKGTKMIALKNLQLIGVTVLLAATLGACDKPGPAETAGKKIDQTANDAGMKISEAADKVSDATSKAGDKISEQSDKAGVAIDDAEITAKIKAAILAEPGLKTLQISVDTIKGVVTLSGSVDSQPNSEMAKSLAGAVSGVTRVENRLELKPVKPK